MSKVIKILNKDTETDESGNIVVEYDKGIQRICALTSVPEKEGRLNIINKKEINTQAYSQEEIKEIEKISTYSVANTIDAKYGSNQTTESLIQEPISVASLEMDKSKLSTTQENEVNFTVTLKENNIKYDLYKNPIIEIELPSFITSVDIEDSNIKVINGNGLEFGSKDIITNNGKRIIVINLKGEQTEYNENTQVLIKANLLTNKLMPNITDNVLLRCTNGKETVYENGQTVAANATGIQTVAEQGILLATTVNNYAEGKPEITLFKNEKQEETGLLNADVKATTAIVKGTIINNTQENLNNIVVLGKINKEDIQTKLSSVVATKGTVYYTEDKDITLESSWSNKYTENATGYKIEFSELLNGATEVFSYNIELPENIGTNKNMEINYELYSGDTKVVAPSVMLQTEQEAKLELKVTPTVKDNEKIYEGQKLSYDITVKNIGETEATNIVINNPVPEGTTIVKNNESQWEIASLKPEETITKTIEITVDNLTDGKKIIENKTTVTARYMAEPLTNTIINQVNKAIIGVSFKLETNYDKVRLNGQIRYIVSITNNTKEKIEKISIENSMPKELKYTYINLIGNTNEFEKLENNIYKLEEISLDPGQTKNIQIDAEVVNYNKDGLVNNIMINWGDNKTATYQDIRDMEIPSHLDIVLKSDKAEKELKTGELITYIATIKNESKKSVNTNINAIVSEGLQIIKVENLEQIDDVQMVASELQTGNVNQVITKLELNAGETKKIRITASVSSMEEELKNDLNLAAQVASVRGEFLEESNIITNIIKKVELPKIEEPKIDLMNPIKDENKQNTESEIKTYSISGIAWLDENKDGKMDSSEKLLNNIVVKIKDFNTGEYLKDANKKEITATTNDKGEYVFNNLSAGKYILIFDCDLKTYGVTTGQISKAVIATEGGTTSIKTDAIAITNKSISNINIGLVLNPKFDLQLDKYITKVTVKTSSETSVYNYDKSQLAKVEIPAKKLKGAIVIIEYTIDVTNNGEVPGYVKSIVDYISPELKFSSESNTSWYQGTDNNLYCIDITNDEIKPGESKSVKLVLTKAITENNLGLVNNIAEICEDYNEYALEDINSKVFNQNEKENDLSSADIIISLKTGSTAMYIGIVIAFTLILGTGIYLINKKVIRV